MNLGHQLTEKGVHLAHDSGTKERRCWPSIDSLRLSSILQLNRLLYTSIASPGKQRLWLREKSPQLQLLLFCMAIFVT
ncbi:hypothetical protein ACU8KH_05400 [Lachancea thermotolerans]